MSVKICCICEYEDAKYKCPRCKQFYCSIACCSKHKENCTGGTETENRSCDTKKGSSENTTVEYEFPTEDTVPTDKLDQLRYSEEVKNCLKNPEVRDIITSIIQNKNPTKAIAEAMIDPAFVELADACLKVVEVSDKDKPC